MAGSSKEDFNLYFYQPSVPLPIVFAVLYFLLLLSHVYLAIYLPCFSQRSRLRKGDRHRHTVPLVVAASLSTAGYIIRVLGAQEDNHDDVTLYSMHSSFLVISPIFVCATLYLMLTRMIRRCLSGPYSDQQNVSDGSFTGSPRPMHRKDIQRFLGVPPIWLGRIFITSDVMSFLTQCAGTGIAASGNWYGSTANVGIWVLRVGLILQLATFIIYLGLFAAFWRRAQSLSPTSLTGGNRKVALGALVASIFVLVRSIYRVVEFFLGIDGYLFQHEWPLYVFESASMLIALAALAWWHPLRSLSPDTQFEYNVEQISEVVKNEQ